MSKISEHLLQPKVSIAKKKSYSICTDSQKAGFCIIAKFDWNINLVLNMAYIHNALAINVLIFAKIIIQQKSKKRCTVQLGFFANTFSCSLIWLCTVTFDKLHDVLLKCMSCLDFPSIFLLVWKVHLSFKTFVPNDTLVKGIAIATESMILLLDEDSQNLLILS